MARARSGLAMNRGLRFAAKNFRSESSEILEARVHDKAYSSHRQRCNNQGSSEWSSYTSSRLTDSVPIHLRGQYDVRSGVDAERTGRTMDWKPSQLIAF